MNARLGDISGNYLLMHSGYCFTYIVAITNNEKWSRSTANRNRGGQNCFGVARQAGWAGDVASDAARLNWTNWKNEEADQADSLPGSVD